MSRKTGCSFDDQFHWRTPKGFRRRIVYWILLLALARDVETIFPVHFTFNMLVTIGMALVYVMGLTLVDEVRPKSTLLKFLKCSSNSFATQLQPLHKIA